MHCRTQTLKALAVAQGEQEDPVPLEVLSPPSSGGPLVPAGREGPFRMLLLNTPIFLLLQGHEGPRPSTLMQQGRTCHV